MGGGRLEGVKEDFRGSRDGCPSFLTTGESWYVDRWSSTNFTGAELRGDAPGGFAFDLKGVRMGDLKGLLTDALRRRRFAGVSMVRYLIKDGMESE